MRQIKSGERARATITNLSMQLTVNQQHVHHLRPTKTRPDAEVPGMATGLSSVFRDATASPHCVAGTSGEMERRHCCIPSWTKRLPLLRRPRPGMNGIAAATFAGRFRARKKRKLVLRDLTSNQEKISASRRLTLVTTTHPRVPPEQQRCLSSPSWQP